MNPLQNYNKITSRDELESLQESVKSGDLIYGRSEFNDGDTELVVFDRDGNRIPLKHTYFITAFGDIYRKNANGEKMLFRENKAKRFELQLEKGERKLYRPHILQLWSYYPNFDWVEFCQNLKLGGTSTVDHILQVHERCHYKFLEAVPTSENARRNNVSTNAEAQTEKRSKTKGKPFHIFIDGMKVEREFSSVSVGAAYLESQYGMKVHSGGISHCLDPNYTKTHIQNENTKNKKLTFDYTEKYKKTLVDLEGEIWKTNGEWAQQEEIIKRFKNMNDRSSPPRAISNRGRVMTGTGRKTHGTTCDIKYHIYNGVPIHILVWLAFKSEELGEKCICHGDVHDSNETDVDGRVIRYSNFLETLSLGSQKENMDDMSEHLQRLAEADPKKRFEVRDSNGDFVIESWYVPDCVKKLNDTFPDITFNGGNIRECLKGTQKTHKTFTFKLSTNT